jgi:hypothetical protein
VICAWAPGEGKTPSVAIPSGHNLKLCQLLLILPPAANLQQIFAYRLKSPIRLGGGRRRRGQSISTRHDIKQLWHFLPAVAPRRGWRGTEFLRPLGRTYSSVVSDWHSPLDKISVIREICRMVFDKSVVSTVLSKVIT